MTTIIQIVTAIALILSIIVPFGTFFLGEKNRKPLQKIPRRELLHVFRRDPC